MMKNKLSHINDDGKAKMVDIGRKPQQSRTAIAEGFIALNDNTLRLIKDNEIKKGDVLTVAEIAGIQAAKQTSHLIPLCHPLLLSKVAVESEIKDKGILIKSLVKCEGQTGVEMEALTAVNVALLTIYDMCKAVDKEMKMGPIQLIKKSKS
jgi:cyclic pyranopterin phosphate synthase